MAVVNHHHHHHHHSVTQPVEIPPLARTRDWRGASKKQKPSSSSPSRRFTGRAPCFVSRIRRPSSSSPSPPPPPPSPHGCCGFKYVPWTECVCAVVPVYPTGGTRAQRGRHSAMVCVCRCFPAGSHGDSTVHVGSRCFGRDDGEQVGYAILPAVVCMQTAWTVRSVVVARMGEDDFDGPHVCLQLRVISFFPSPMSASVVMPPSPNRAL